MNAKYINAKQAKETYQYRNIKGKLYKTNAAIWYNKICREKQLAICLLLYVQSGTPDDGRRDRPKHVECYAKINNLSNWCM
jgi:hypothetical protein